MKQVSEILRDVTRNFVFVLVMMGLSLSGSLVNAQNHVMSYQGTLNQHEAVVSDGLYQLTVTLYGDPQGENAIWTDSYSTEVKNGIFNIQLGSGKALPDSKTMDQPLWLGVAINGTDELRPLTKLGAVSLALNVADEAVTLKKLAPEVISLMANQTEDPQATSGSVFWSETGNYSLTPGTHFLGTTDASALEVKVNSNRVMYYVPNATSSNILGGSGANTIDLVGSSSTVGAVISGGGNSSNPNRIGYGNGTTSTNSDYAFLGGGNANKIDGPVSVLGGGYSNHTIGQWAFLGGGYDNIIGVASPASGANYSVLTGGYTNTVTGEYSFIGSGSNNTASNTRSSVVGGASNTASGQYSFVGGGSLNVAAGNYSAIPGGRLLTVGANSFGFSASSNAIDVSANTSIAYFGNVNLWLGNDDNTARQLRFYEPNSGNYTSFKAQAQSADINYTLPVDDGTSNQVLTTDGSGALSWANSSDANAWKITGNSGTSAGTNFLGTTDNVRLFLQVKSGSAVNNSLILNTNGSIQRDNGGNTRGINAVDLQIGRANATEVARSSYSVISGGFANTVGNASGLIGEYGAIGGGEQNIAEGNYSTIGGGINNQALDESSTVGGGALNSAEMSYAIVGGGLSNLAKQEYSTIAGGTSNLVNQPWSTIGGGRSNLINAAISLDDGYSFIGGGESNIIGDPAASPVAVDVTTAVIVGGDENNVRGRYSSLVGGHHNRAIGNNSFVGGGGSLEHISGYYSNQANGDHTVVVGGGGNIADGDFSFIGGGGEDPGLDLLLNPIVRENRYNKTTTDAKFATIPGGRGLWAQSYGQTVLGVFNKKLPTATEANFLGAKANERILIIGNGTAPANTDDPDNGSTRSNAFEVSNNGHSIVYHNNSSATNPAIKGARYIDNTVIAWGEIDGTTLIPTITSGFGLMYTAPSGTVPGPVRRVGGLNSGAFRIYLNYTDPYTGAQVQITGGSSVVATIRETGCKFISTSPLQWNAGYNYFDVDITEQVLTGSPTPELECQTDDERFMFVVYARP